MWSPVMKAMFCDDFVERYATVIELPGKRFDDVLELVRVLHPPNKPINGRLFIQRQCTTMLICCQFNSGYKPNLRSGDVIMTVDCRSSMLSDNCIYIILQRRPIEFRKGLELLKTLCQYRTKEMMVPL